MTSISFESLVENNEINMSDVDFDELAIQIESIETEMNNMFKSMDQKEEIKDIRASLLEVTLEGDTSLLNHYRTSLKLIGIDCSTNKTAADGIAEVVAKFEERGFSKFIAEHPQEEMTEEEKAEAQRVHDEEKAALESKIEEAKVSLESAEGEEAKAAAQLALDEASAALESFDISTEVFTAAASYSGILAIYITMLSYVATVIMSVEGRVNVLQQIIDKGLRSEPKDRDKKLFVVPATGWSRIIPNCTKALQFMFDNISNFEDTNAKKVTGMMESAGAVWNGKDYVTVDWGLFSKMTVEQSKWTPAAVISATKDLKAIIVVMAKAKNIIKQVKDAAKKANKEDGGGFFKKSDRSKEIKANARLASKTLRYCTQVAFSSSRMLVPVAKQYEQ